ncbi:PSD1 and planctomycete cytochrome C domain-containing protein [Bremerella sp.]|uniref:PSD1 and planctomycete cytochrome C domain-containing protein n=1 Tax=Bremerella sp. TaxID=2795602 RepID=UPI00391A2DE3
MTQLPHSGFFVRLLTCIAAVAVFGLGPGTCWAAEDGNAPVSFERDIYPLLQKACFECHGAETQEADLRVDERTALFDSGSIVPGRPEDSELLRRVALPNGHDEIMPAVGDPLLPSEVRSLRQWIASGANWPEGFIPPKHWAYVKPNRPQLPQINRQSWTQSPIDHFVLAKLESASVEPSPAASPEKLLRRVHFDLIGLPPTPAEVDAFVADPSQEHFRQIVDELLARPQFGERWARPWLDLARYADSHGFQRDDLREIWAYRDWVIQAMNDDMPFDRFTIEQIAGDLLPDATESSRIATGFHRCAPTNVEAGSLPEETRTEQIIDRVNTTGAVWLGTTLECCQCHDHKYDPFPMKDYYRMLAFFNSTKREADRTNPKQPSSIAFQGPSMDLADAEKDQRRKELQTQQAKIKKQRTVRRGELQADLKIWVTTIEVDAMESMPDPVKKVIAKGPEQWTDKEEKTLLDFCVEQDTSSQKLGKQLNKIERDLKAAQPDTTLVMIELEQARPTHIFERGNYQNPGELVEPGTPETLHAMPEGPANRLTLGRWLASQENPLVARVVVNRWWAELFGQGIVATEEDFGIKGELPTHPELLDWLAVELMENGWSRKQLLREIVLSATYQQSSKMTKQLLEVDDQNKLLARGPRIRMDAEMIRDNALAISGLLSLKQFGPPIRPYQPEGIWTKVGGQKYNYQVSPGSEQHRRGIYVVLKRGSPYPSFLNFDGTARLACTVQRSRTNTPLQALTLLNDPVYVEAAQALAKRIQSEANDLPLKQQLEYAFQLCTARKPNESELATLTNLVKLYPDDADKAWESVATVLLNLHETITKD